MAIFDRHNLIKVTKELRSTLESTITAIAKGNAQEAVKSLIKDEVSNNQEAETIATQVATNLKLSNDISKDLGDIILPLRKMGVHIPVNTSLILRNIFNLNRLAKKAGFNSLIDGFLHTASDEEISDISTMLH